MPTRQPKPREGSDMRSPFAVTFRLAGVFLMLAILSGCMSGKEEVEKWVQQEKAKKGTPIDPPPAIKTFETFANHASVSLQNAVPSVGCV